MCNQSMTQACSLGQRDCGSYTLHYYCRQPGKRGRCGGTPRASLTARRYTRGVRPAVTIVVHASTAHLFGLVVPRLLRCARPGKSRTRAAAAGPDPTSVFVLVAQARPTGSTQELNRGVAIWRSPRDCRAVFVRQFLYARQQRSGKAFVLMSTAHARAG